MAKIIARKRFGQHFLHDQNVIARIIAAINPKISDHIVEIGPGLGALTKHLLPLVKTYDAIELDREIAPKLIAACKNIGQLNLYIEDALKFNFSNLVVSKKIRLVGNLPYNISTQLIFHLFEFIQDLQDMHFMLQQEVVARMAAKSGGKSFGGLSVMTQYFCDVEGLFSVAPEAFTPKPKVYSAIVRLIPKQPELVAKDVDLLRKVVTSAFSQRRKVLRNSLKVLISNQDLEQLNIDGSKRAEQLQVTDFVKISNFIYQFLNKGS